MPSATLMIGLNFLEDNSFIKLARERVSKVYLVTAQLELFVIFFNIGMMK